MSKGYVALAFLIAITLLSGGLAHALIEHEHDGPFNGEMLHAAIHSEYFKALLLLLIPVLLFSTQIPELFGMLFYIRRILESEPDPFRKALLRGSIRSVYV